MHRSREIAAIGRILTERAAPESAAKDPRRDATLREQQDKTPTHAIDATPTQD
tara:strand:- start:48 stop:206 length:159 start_codon:yes stop_codon:yes gene_type:complete